MGSVFSGLTGAGTESQSSSLETRNLLNFAPFQQPAIDQVFGALTPNLLGLAPNVSGLSTSSLSGFQGLLDRFARAPADDDLRGFMRTASDVASLAGQFNPAIDLFEEVFDESGDLIRSELARNPIQGSIDFLTPFARGDFLDRGNPFADRIVQAALDDALARTTGTFSQAGRLRSGIAPQAVASQAGRISGAIRGPIFEAERGRQLGAATTIGQLRLNEAVNRLNAIRTGSDVRLRAAQGVLGGRTAEQSARLAGLGLAGNIGSRLLGAQQFGLANALPQAALAAQLPFVPLTNFSNIAFAPLGQSGTIARTSETESTSTRSPLSTALGLGLTGASLFENPFASAGTLASTGAPGFGPFGTNLGPLSAPAPPIPFFQ